MRTSLRGLVVVCLLFAATSLVALWAGVGQVELPPPLRFDPTPFVLAATPDWTGEKTFQVGVVNNSDQPARIIGVQEFCGAACFSGGDLPVDIPAGGRAVVGFGVRANRAGPMTAGLTFFTDQPSQPTITLKVEGNLPEPRPHEQGGPDVTNR